MPQGTVSGVFIDSGLQAASARIPGSQQKNRKMNEMGKIWIFRVNRVIIQIHGSGFRARKEDGI